MRTSVVERNARITAAFQAGTSQRELARQFGLSKGRVWQIINRYERPELRAPITAAEAGRLGARTRWGPQRVLRFDALHPNVAAAVRALIDADEAAQKRPIEPWDQALNELTKALERFAVKIGGHDHAATA